eukprot:4129200-Amphidinium_carterae.1
MSLNCLAEWPHARPFVHWIRRLISSRSALTSSPAPASNSDSQTSVGDRSTSFPSLLTGSKSSGSYRRSTIELRALLGFASVVTPCSQPTFILEA